MPKAKYGNAQFAVQINLGLNSTSGEVQNTTPSQHDAKLPVTRRALMKIYSNADFWFKPNSEGVSNADVVEVTLYFIIPWILFLLFIVAPCV